MRKIIFTFILFILLFPGSTYSQFEDIIKNIPGVEDIFFEEAVSTSIKDSYPAAWWLTELDKQIGFSPYTKYNDNLPAGYYKYNFKTFCLHAGAYTPGEGNGYLVAPLKGSKAKLINKILNKYSEHPEIVQTDVQILIWGVEAGAKYSTYQPDFQFRIAPLLDPEDIAQMEVDVKEIAMDLLPQDVKDILNVYNGIRQKIADPLATYEQIEQIAVRTGIPPLGKGSRSIDAGVWTALGNNTYIRAFPFGFNKTEVEVYIPSEPEIKRDAQNRIVSLDDGNSKIEITYDDAPGSNSLNNQNPIHRFKTIILSDLNTGQSQTIENEGWYIPSLKKQSGEYTRSNDPSLDEYNSRKDMTAKFIKEVKRSIKGKKTKKLSKTDLSAIEELKQLELSLKSLFTINEPVKNLNGKIYKLAIDASNSYLSSFITTDKKGGSYNSPPGGITNFVFAPANTSRQRLGTSGEGDPTGDPTSGNEGDPTSGNEGDPGPEEEKEKKCEVKVTLQPVEENELPKPDWVFSVIANIQIEGNADNCNAEEISWELFDVSKEKGRYMNDKEKMEDVEEDLQMSDANEGYTLTKTTAKKQIGGKSQTQAIHIVCKDYGAYGKIKVTVTVGGKQYEGIAEGSQFVSIPLDRDDNKIADGWEKQMGVPGMSALSDEDAAPSGQARNGDGMTNYEEYRGFFVSDGSTGSEYKRMNPKQKEIFVLDEYQLFSIVSWKAASDITAYWLTGDLVYGTKAGSMDNDLYRWVDFCNGYAQGNKYAVNILKSFDMNDPKGVSNDKYELGYCPVYGPPVRSGYVMIFPERIKNWLKEQRDTLIHYLKQRPQGYKIDGVIYRAPVIQKLIDALGDAQKFQVIYDFVMYYAVIHEVGHACGVRHHGGGDESKIFSGDINCPTKYRNTSAIAAITAGLGPILEIIKREGVIPSVTYTKLKFCTSPDNCWKQINVNDK
ncbi:MAG: hypothetical protein EHM58_12115 [Ignavibacteriae bacterium]|nr:MAG: hypothetical protein EHM58_12115 [Ignavibacteriota bacterium]